MGKRFAMTVCGLVLAAGWALQAQPQTQTSFVGEFADTTAALAGAWALGGEWALQVKGQSGKADFNTGLTMSRSDYWMLTTGADPNDPAARNAHTHHVAFEDGLVSPLANGFRVIGMARVTSNGNAVFGGPVPVQVDIVGGGSVPAANIKLTFGGAAAGHFGTQAISGVVRGAK